MESIESIYSNQFKMNQATKRTKLENEQELSNASSMDYILGLDQMESIEREEKREDDVNLSLMDLVSLVWYQLFQRLCVKMHVFDSFEFARQEIRVCFFIKYMTCQSFKKLEYPVYILNSIETTMKMLKYMVHVNLYGYGPIGQVNLYRLYCRYLSDQVKDNKAKKPLVTVIITRDRLENCLNDSTEEEKEKKKRIEEDIQREPSRLVRSVFEKMIIQSVVEGPSLKSLVNKAP